MYRVFADSPKVLVKPEKSAVSMRSHKTTTTVNTMSTGSNLAGLGPASAAAYYYNDATAAGGCVYCMHFHRCNAYMIVLVLCCMIVYEEWSIVKKNKFGRRQERVFGVDGEHRIPHSFSCLVFFACILLVVMLLQSPLMMFATNRFVCL